AMLALAAIDGRIALSPAALVAARLRLDAPTPRVALGQALRGIASAAIDVSDGLCGDLAHILDASSVGASIRRADLPRSAAMDQALGANAGAAARDIALHCLVAGGDDYELCFAAPPRARAQIDAIGATLGVRVTRAGVITAERTLALCDEHGRPVTPLPRAYDHFAAA
ncbi:MAG: thiamine-phosphate kinase, partial [Casimicrobiaceae bacterium]